MTALTVYERVDNPLAFVEAMAESTAIMIPGCDIKAGRALAMMLLRRNMDAMDFIQRYHFIQGKPTMRADAMLAEFRLNKGGKHRIIQRTPEVAEAEFTTADGDVYTFKLTWEEAQQERYPWAKGCGPGTGKMAPTFENLKDNWSTPQGRKQMMWARLTSDSLRAIVPELVAGIYTPEEAIDFEENQPARPVAKKPTADEVIAAAASAPTTTIVSNPAPAPVDVADGNVEDAEFTPAEYQQGLEPHEPGSAQPAELAQLHKLGEEFYGEAWATKLSEALTRRNCSVDKNLSSEQAIQLCKAIEGFIRDRKLE
jgi:hypothetical protein